MSPFKKFVTRLKHLFPSVLPLNMDEMNVFIEDIITANSLPNDKSYHHAISGAIMHLGPVTSHKSKRWFAKSVRKAIANQVAYQKIKSLQDEEKKAMEQEFLNKEVTPKAASLNGPVV